MDRKKQTTHAKAVKPAPEQVSLSSSVGYNLSEFSFSPLARQTQEFAGQTILHEWSQALPEGRERECYFELSYGQNPPNAYTEDTLLVLVHLSQQSKDPLSFPASLYEICKLLLQNPKYSPGKSQINQVVRDLNALMDTTVDTNFIYDREEGKWSAVRTSVLAGYTYKDREGRIRRQLRHNVTASGEVVRYVADERVMELKKISWAPDFFRYFIQDGVPLDLALYFSLEKPTAKRIFRYGNKYIQELGSHAIDLQQFCLTRIGMSANYVDDKHPSYLKSKLIPHISRVNETGRMIVGIEKANTPSQYKITFHKSVVQVPLISLNTTYTKGEEQAYNDLVKLGLYPNIARSFVVEYRNKLGKEGAQYLKFAARQFKKELIDTERLRVPERGTPGVLKKAIENDWYYPHFIEWNAEKEKKEWRDEYAKYEETQKLALPQAGNTLSEERAALARARSLSFSIDHFKAEYTHVYTRIVEAVSHKYQLDSAAEAGLQLSKAVLDQMCDNAINSYCKKCFEEFNRGNADYFPPILC